MYLLGDLVMQTATLYLCKLFMTTAIMEVVTALPEDTTGVIITIATIISLERTINIAL